MFVDVLIVYIIRTLWRLGNLLRCRSWSTVNAVVLESRLNKSAYESVSLDYEYEADGQKRTGTFLKPFISTSSAKAYADEYPPAAKFKIRIKPEDSSVSVADASVEHWWTN
jgi:hypothetical protein